MVTISRQAGAGGDEIARLLAEELGWKVLDNDAVERLLVEKGFTRAEAETFEEKEPGLWHRFSSEKEKYLHFLKMVSYEFARRADCITLGRGGQILFADVPGVIRVRVIAPLQDRVARVRDTSGGDEHRARQTVQHSDNERTGFYRFLFHANWDAPDLYDLIINTHSLSLEDRHRPDRECGERERDNGEETGSLPQAGKPLPGPEGHRRRPVRTETPDPLPGNRVRRWSGHAQRHGAGPAVHRALPGDGGESLQCETGQQRDPLRAEVRGTAGRH